jgi:prepilin-type processing-associated H-X9-DG protein/prepilin-type N-terminal cleavage/methylation domain-containing protein
MKKDLLFRFSAGTKKSVRAGGFTLVEILVAVAILAILVALLIPVIGKSLKSARMAACLHNLRQVGNACQLYSSDNNGDVPPLYDMGTTFSVLLAPYAGGMKAPSIAPDIFYCPENVAQNSPPAGGYRVTSEIYYKGWSGYFLGYLVNGSVHSQIYLDIGEVSLTRRAVKRVEIQRPSKTVSLMDLSPWPQNGAPPSSGLAREYYFDPSQSSFALGTPHQGLGNVLFCDGHAETFSGKEKLHVISLPDQTEVW